MPQTCHLFVCLAPLFLSLLLFLSVYLLFICLFRDLCLILVVIKLPVKAINTHCCPCLIFTVPLGRVTLPVVPNLKIYLSQCPEHKLTHSSWLCLIHFWSYVSKTCDIFGLEEQRWPNQYFSHFSFHKNRKTHIFILNKHFYSLWGDSYSDTQTNTHAC